VKDLQCRYVYRPLRVGDYPGQGEASGFMHAGECACHYCRKRVPKNQALQRHVWCGHAAYLPRGHAGRGNNADYQPEGRTHNSVIEDAQLSAEYDGDFDDREHPRRRTGVNFVTPLAVLPLFSLIWDFLPDWMHIIKGLIGRHLLYLFRGDRNPSKPRPLVERDADSREQKAARKAYAPT
jgi:hypothetical protein